MSDRDKDAGIPALRHRLTVLERRLGDRRLRFAVAGRARLAALPHPLPRRVLRRLPLTVHPDTVPRWHRDPVRGRHAAASRPKRPGRSSTVRSIRALGRGTHRPRVPRSPAPRRRRAIPSRRLLSVSAAVRTRPLLLPPETTRAPLRARPTCPSRQSGSWCVARVGCRFRVRRGPCARWWRRWRGLRGRCWSWVRRYRSRRSTRCRRSGARRGGAGIRAKRATSLFHRWSRPARVALIGIVRVPSSWPPRSSRCVLASIDRTAYPMFRGTVTARELVESGRPVLARRKGAERRPAAITLEAAVLDRLPDRALLDILARTAHLTGWPRHFGPASGSDPKIRDTLGRYVVTAFAYGGNLGPTEAARHMRGVSAHEIYTAGNKHATPDKIYKASTDVVNAFTKLDVAAMWGDGSTAATDGSQIDTWEDSLRAESHVRYGGFGALAFRLVSDNYIALFSHFIPLRGVGGGVPAGLAAVQRLRHPARHRPRRHARGFAAGVRPGRAPRIRPPSPHTQLARPELLPAGRQGAVQTHRLPVRRQRHRLGPHRTPLEGSAAHRDLDPGGPTVLGDAAAPPGQPLEAQPDLQGATRIGQGRQDRDAPSIPVRARAACPDHRDHQPHGGVPRLRYASDDRRTADRPQRPGLPGESSNSTS